MVVRSLSGKQQATPIPMKIKEVAAARRRFDILSKSPRHDKVDKLAGNETKQQTKMTKKDR